MVYRRNKHLSRTALRFVAALHLFYKSLNSSNLIDVIVGEFAPLVTYASSCLECSPSRTVFHFRVSFRLRSMYMLRFSLLLSSSLMGWVVTYVTSYKRVHRERERKRERKREKRPYYARSSCSKAARLCLLFTPTRGLRRTRPLQSSLCSQNFTVRSCSSVMSASSNCAQFKVAPCTFASIKFAPVRSAPVRSASARFAPRRSLNGSFASSRLAPQRSASLRLAPMNLASMRLAPRKLAW
jgi:hypothetical protein